ncbi:MAG: hypothetical protein KAQ68_05815 [Clostridiales bacterium]|nr:hypothetical protein [Clostridiales bacterium]
MKNIPNEIEIINLGSSHAQFAIDYNSLKEYKGYDFSIPAQSFMYDLNILKQYQKHLSDDCVVIIPISYFDYYEDYPIDNVIKRQRRFYYPILNINRIKYLNILDILIYKWLPILNIDKENLVYIVEDDKNAISNYERKFQQNKYYSSETQSIDIDGFLFENDIKVYGHSKNFAKGVNPYSIEQLKTIVEYCLAKGYRPLLITTPFSDYYNAAEDFTEDFYEEFYQITNNISQQYNIEYWDYSHDIRFTNDITLFYDNNHLNKGKGISLFSSIFFDRLKIEGYLK